MRQVEEKERKSVVTTREMVRGEPETTSRDFSRSRGQKSVEKHVGFFTGTERGRAGQGDDVCLDTALPQEHCYRQGQYKDRE